MSKSYLLSELAEFVGGVVRGDANVCITGVNGVVEATAEEITWLADEKYTDRLNASRAGAVVIDESFGETTMPAIVAKDPAYAFAQILEKFALAIPAPAVGVHSSAVVAESAVLGPNVAIGPHVVIGERAQIGEGTVIRESASVGAEARIGRMCSIWHGVVIRERCQLGDRVEIHPNATIGADGFGYHFVKGRHHKIPQIGIVEIGDDVEIGACSCIDRAKFGATRIGSGTKIDNLVQVAHNVQIGSCCIIVSQCGLAGSVQLGRGVVLGGKVGVKDHIRIGDGCRVGALSGVTKDVPAGSQVMGMPPMSMKQFARERANVKQFPRLVEQLKDLIKRVEQLEASADD